MPDNLRHAQYDSEGIQIDDPQELVRAEVSGAGISADEGNALITGTDSKALLTSMGEVEAEAGTATTARAWSALQVRLGDDSGFTRLQGQLQAHANATAETITATHTIILYDAAGTAYKVPCVPA